jgi:hypothetical protein
MLLYAAATAVTCCLLLEATLHSTLAVEYIVEAVFQRPGIPAGTLNRTDA